MIVVNRSVLVHLGEAMKKECCQTHNLFLPASHHTFKPVVLDVTGVRWMSFYLQDTSCRMQNI